MQFRKIKSTIFFNFICKSHLKILAVGRKQWLKIMSALKVVKMSFISRHPKLAQHKEEAASIVKSYRVYRRMKKWVICCTLKISYDKKLQTFNIFNVDETVLSTELKPWKVIAKKDGHKVWSMISVKCNQWQVLSKDSYYRHIFHEIDWCFVPFMLVLNIKNLRLKGRLMFSKDYSSESG